MINCVGKYQGGSRLRISNADWDVLHSSDVSFPGIAFMDWCFGNPLDRQNVDTFFRLLFTLLSDSTTVLYVHCKNGRDRSGAMIYAILRICFTYNDAKARATLQTRLDTAGEILHPREDLLQAWKNFIEATFED